MKRIWIVIIALISVSLSACVEPRRVHYDDDRYYKSGPPPHAPAHGYRAKYHHHDLIYDSLLRAYVVRGYRDHYYSDGWYFRYRDGNWEISTKLDDKWRYVDRYRVPEGLRYSKQRHHKNKKKHQYDD